LFILLFILLFM